MLSRTVSDRYGLKEAPHGKVLLKASSRGITEGFTSNIKASSHPRGHIDDLNQLIEKLLNLINAIMTGVVCCNCFV